MARKLRTFEGYASTFDPDLGGDVIQPGAYADTIRAFKAGRVIPLIDSHDSFSSVRNVLGHVAELEEDDRGLKATFAVVPGTDGDELLHRLRSGSVTGLSIGYTIPSGGAHEMDNGWRALSSVDVHEVSAVAFPMNEASRVLTVEGAETRAGKALAAAVAEDGAPDMTLFRKLMERQSREPDAEPVGVRFTTYDDM